VSVFRDAQNNLYFMGFFLQFYQVVDPEKYKSLKADYDRYVQRFQVVAKTVNKSSRGGANQ